MIEKQINIKKFSEKNQKVVYEVAKKFGGETTVSDIYANSNLSIDEIEDILVNLNSKNYVKSALDEKTSVIKYTFPELKNQLLNTEGNFTSKTGIDKLILRIKYNNSSQKPTQDLEKAILQTAQEFKGHLAMSKILEYTGLSVDEAEDILSLLSAKGICKREFNSDFHNPEFYFPEIIETSKESEEKDYKSEKNLVGIAQNFSKGILGKFKKNTDRMLIKNRVSRYKRKYKRNLFLDTVSPGVGHLVSKQWTPVEYLTLIILPMILTAGISIIPTSALMRYETIRYYSLSQRDLRKKVFGLHINSAIYITVMTAFYAHFIGIEGIKYYYHLISILFGL